MIKVEGDLQSYIFHIFIMGHFFIINVPPKKIFIGEQAVIHIDIELLSQKLIKSVYLLNSLT